MTTKTRAARKARRTRPAAPPPQATAQQALREGWKSALEALSRAEAEVEARVKQLLRSNKINVEDAAELLREFKNGVEKERARGMRDVEKRFGELQQRVRREGQNVANVVTEAVQSGLAALNIPSRKEVALLTKKVDELSRRIAAQRGQRGQRKKR